MGLVHNETERWAATCFFGCFSEAYDTGAFGRARVAGVRGRAKMIPVDWKLSGEIISLLLALSFKSVEGRHSDFVRFLQFAGCVQI